MVGEYISPEDFSTLPPEEQDRIMWEYLKEFSQNDLLAIKHLIEQTDRSNKPGRPQTTARAGTAVRSHV